MTAARVEIGTYRFGATGVVVRSNDTSFHSAARWCFRDLEASGAQHAPTIVIDVDRRPDVAHRWQIAVDGVVTQGDLTHDYVLFHLQWELNRLHLGSTAVSLHAAAVELNGQGLVLCGESHSGKTTLAAWLTSRGATFVADEVVGLNDGGARMTPYVRPLGLRHDGPMAGTWSVGESFDTSFVGYEWLVPASVFGDVSRQRDHPINLIVFPKVVPKATTAVTWLSPSEAFERLCRSSPSLAVQPSNSFTSLAVLARSVPAITMTNGDLDVAYGRLSDVLDHSELSGPSGGGGPDG